MTPRTPVVPPGMVQRGVLWRQAPDLILTLPYVRQTPAKPRPTRLHPPRRTQAPPAPPSRAPRTPRTPRWELSTVPPRPTIYSNRVGMDPDLPLTRLPVHNLPDCFHSVSVLHATSLIFYAT